MLKREFVSGELCWVTADDVHVISVMGISGHGRACKVFEVKGWMLFIVCLKRELGVNITKVCRVSLFGGDDGTMCEIEIKGKQIEKVHEFKHVGCMVAYRDLDIVDYEKRIE